MTIAYQLGVRARIGAASATLGVEPGAPAAQATPGGETASVPTTDPPAEATPPAPVLFKNPFDPSEVFEFPAGTSDAEARDAVADFLLKRAHERRIDTTQRPSRDPALARGTT